MVRLYLYQNCSYASLNLLLELWTDILIYAIMFIKYRLTACIMQAFNLHKTSQWCHMSAMLCKSTSCSSVLGCQQRIRRITGNILGILIWSLKVNTNNMRRPSKEILYDIQTYSISQEICTRFLLCCALLWLYIDWFSHIHQAYFTGIVAI